MGVETKKHAKELKIIGKKIQALRKAKGYTQSEVAEKLDITRVYMGYIEQGRESPSLQLMFRLASLLDVKVQDLVEM